MRLRVLPDQPTIDPVDDGASDRESPSFQLNGVPAKAAQFAASRSRGRRELQEGTEVVALRSGLLDQPADGFWERGLNWSISDPGRRRQHRRVA